MTVIEKANSYHEKGYNCCQSVLGAFADRFDIPEETALRLGAGFGSGAGTGELCGAITGAILALDLIAGGDMNQPLASKRAAAAKARAVQQRFVERFGAVRCRDLLKNEKEEASEAVRALGVTNHCGVMIATAAELVEEMLKEEEK